MSDVLLAAAREEAQRLDHPYIGTEHLLLALLRLGEPSLRTLLADAGVAPERARARLEKARRGRRPPVRPGADGVPGVTSHARRALETAAGDPAALVATLRADSGSLLARLLAPADRAEPGQEAPAKTAPAASPPSQPPAARKPARDRSPRSGNEKSRAPRPSRDQRPARTPRAPSTATSLDDDEPPFVPRLAVQPRRPRKFPWRALLLVLVPITIALDVRGAPPVLLFAIAAAGVVPLAGYLSKATEHLVARSGPTLGGLLSASFGNAAALVIAVVALKAGLVGLVKATIVGSIVGNLMVILGLALLAGGWKAGLLRFNRTAAGMSSAMLALAVFALVLPALLHQVHPRPDELNAFRMSEAAALMLSITYLCSLLFPLRAHRPLFGGDLGLGRPASAAWPAVRGVTVLALATAGMVVQSEVLVHAVQELTITLGWSEFFLGLIVIPLIGNVTEHAGAVVAARKGTPDLALQIVVGSSTQIALLVVPLLVAAGLLFGVRLDLVFSPFEVMAIVLATGVTAIITLVGESNWFKGVQLLAVYTLLAVAAWFI